MGIIMVLKHSNEKLENDTLIYANQNRLLMKKATSKINIKEIKRANWTYIFCCGVKPKSIQIIKKLD